MSDAAMVARALAGVRAAGGAALLARPDALTRPLCGGRRVPAAWVVRTLGARMLVQGAVEVLRPRRDVLLAGAAVDGTHAASMLGLAAISRDYRPIAMVSAGTAAASGLGALAAAAALHGAVRSGATS